MTFFFCGKAEATHVFFSKNKSTSFCFLYPSNNQPDYLTLQLLLTVYCSPKFLMQTTFSFSESLKKYFQQIIVRRIKFENCSRKLNISADESPSFLGIIRVLIENTFIKLWILLQTLLFWDIMIATPSSSGVFAVDLHGNLLTSMRFILSAVPFCYKA